MMVFFARNSQKHRKRRGLQKKEAGISKTPKTGCREALRLLLVSMSKLFIHRSAASDKQRKYTSQDTTKRHHRTAPAQMKAPNVRYRFSYPEILREIKNSHMHVSVYLFVKIATCTLVSSLISRNPKRNKK
jgi:hypothetical protein